MTKQEKLANYEMMKNECFETRKLNDSLGKLIVVKNKKIKELEQKLEQTEKDLADYQFNYPTIKELQNENAELKERLKEHESIGNAQFWENVWSWKTKADQLTKVKELLKEFVHHYKSKTIYVENMQDLLEQSEQFISEVEK